MDSTMPCVSVPPCLHSLVSSVAKHDLPLTVDRGLRHCGWVILPRDSVEATHALPQVARRWRGLGPSLRACVRWAPLMIWFVGLAAIMSALAVGHWFALPHPDKQDARLSAGMRQLLSGRDGWAAVHVLYTDCPCSRRIFDHLLESTRPVGMREVVLLVGDDPAIERRIRARPYEVVTVAPEALSKRFGIEGAPLLVVVDPQRQVRYIGGYTDRKQGLDIRDLAIIREVRAGVAISELPLFGCAVSQRLKELADPLAIKR
jgi:hypothetical protein